MSAVMVTRTPDGYTVARTFRSQSAAQRATNLLLDVCEPAFVPVTPLTVALEVAEADDLDPHDGRLNPPRTDTGD